MLDKLQGSKDTLRNFIEWLHRRPAQSGAAWIGPRTVKGDVDPAAMDMLLEDFLATQGSKDGRFVPVCGHCGSENVTSDMFQNQPAPSHLPPSIRASWKPGVGPAWRCLALDCGHFTNRGVDAEG
jgi:hypothetical protein